MASPEDFSGLSREDVGNRIQVAIDEAPEPYRGNKVFVAALIGKNPDTLDNYINGISEIGAITMWKLAQITGKPIGWFVGEEHGSEAKLDVDLRRLLRAHRATLIRQLKEIDAALD